MGQSTRKLTLLGIGTGILSALLFLVEYLGTVLGGMIYGGAMASALGVRPASRAMISSVLGGGIGFFVAFATAIGLGRAPGSSADAWIPLLSFPVGGFLGTAVMSLGLRLSGVPLVGRSLRKYLLVGTIASYAVLVLALFGIPIWQGTTAAVLSGLRMQAEEDSR